MLVASEAIAAPNGLEVKSGLGFELSDLNFICSNVYLIILFLKNSISKEKKEAKEDMLTCVLRRR